MPHIIAIKDSQRTKYLVHKGKTVPLEKINGRTNRPLGKYPITLAEGEYNLTNLRAGIAADKGSNKERISAIEREQEQLSTLEEIVKVKW